MDRDGDVFSLYEPISSNRNKLLEGGIFWCLFWEFDANECESLPRALAEDLADFHAIKLSPPQIRDKMQVIYDQIIGIPSTSCIGLHGFSR